jgi:hypothetical protein
MDTTRCIISLATDRGSYSSGLARLGRSLRRVGFKGEFCSWPPGNFPRGCPAHLEAPFAFKPFCFAEARADGQKMALWLDSSCLVIRSLDPIFEAIEANGYLLFKNGPNLVGEWASDLALSEFGLSREEALLIPEVNSAAVGLNISCPIGIEFLDSWLEAARKEIPFRGIANKLRDWNDYEDVKWNRSGRVSADSRVHGHRHDQTVAGILAQRLGMELTPDLIDDYRRQWAVTPIRPTTRIVIDRSMRGGPRATARIWRDKQLGRIAHRFGSPGFRR